MGGAPLFLALEEVTSTLRLTEVICVQRERKLHYFGADVSQTSHSKEHIG